MLLNYNLKLTNYWAEKCF